MRSEQSSFNSECKKDDKYRGKSKSVKLYRNRRPPNNLSGIGKRHILGFYSMNADYEFTDDLSQLRYLKRPPEQNQNVLQNVKFDLKRTSEQTVKRKLITTEEKTHLLKWIVAHRQSCFEPSGPRGFLEFVTSRGLLTKVMETPYEKREGWIVCATKFQGRIYLCRFETQDCEQKNAEKTDKEKEISDWGYVFQQYLVSESPEQPPNLNLPTNQNEEFHCVFRSKLGKHNILIGAEMDAVTIDAEKVSSTVPELNSETLKIMLKDEGANFVELKTSAKANETSNDKEWRKICRHKSRQWWTQCHVSGIKELICGYRDDDGVVSMLEYFDVTKLPNLGKELWNTDVCFEYCTTFLDFVKEHVMEGPDEMTWKFEWYPEYPDSIGVGRCGSDSPYLFLHKWFTDAFQGSLKRKAESNDPIN